MDEDWAHAPPCGSGHAPHGLDDHLRSVGKLAGHLAHGDVKGLARLAGLWHDLGKRRTGFQKYIRLVGGADAHIERVADRDKTHSAAGALWAEQYLQQCGGRQGLLLARALQYVIAGHHAGLDDWEGGLANRLATEDAWNELAEALHGRNSADILTPEVALPAYGQLAIQDEHKQQQPGRFALHVRMLFSALVDADFLDTEAYMDGDKAPARVGAPQLPAMQSLLQAHLDGLTRHDTAVNRARAQVLTQCRERAAESPGVFSLTVPTGGGKTLSSLNFALNHAVAHGKRRVVVAIPYTSIIEQTADVFRNVFAPLGDEAVIEHHSNAEADPERENARSRLACENWDAPLIVTTNVQLFESLFARKTSRCRKLHSLADSVIVLDEAQLLPVEFLQPIVDVLRYLVQDFGVTLLLCTATQPVLDAPARFDAQRGLRRGLPQVTEIIDDVPGLYRALERVQVRLPPNLETPRAWPELADEIASQEAVLGIVSRRADAAELYRLVKACSGGEGCWHLSALMCAQHRSDAIADIKAALHTRRAALAEGRAALPVRVLSTQLVEAGVDLDFPVVYRALAGLDSIAQAAGRCNREGKLNGLGEVHVFVPPTDAPPGLLQTARGVSRKVLADRPFDPLHIDLVRRYFEVLLADAGTCDKEDICNHLKLQPVRETHSLPIRFRQAADAFKLIDNADAATVLVRYRSPRAKDDIDALIGKLERDGPARWLMRKLQRYGVTIYQHDLKRLIASGDVREVPSCPGLYLATWDGFYDPELGAQVDTSVTDVRAYVS